MNDCSGEERRWEPEVADCENLIYAEFTESIVGKERK